MFRKRKTVKQESIEREAINELIAGSEKFRFLEQTDKMTAQMLEMASAFNVLRDQLARQCDLIRSVDSEIKKYTSVSSEILHGDFDLLIKDQDEMNQYFCAEDSEAFMACVKKIKAMKRFDDRMKACSVLNKQIKESIVRWQDKIDKMKTLSISRGSSLTESNVAAKKIIQFQEAINILKKRGSEITDIYYKTKKKILKWIEDVNEEFEDVNYQDRPMPDYINFGR